MDSILLKCAISNCAQSDDYITVSKRHNSISNVANVQKLKDGK